LHLYITITGKPIAMFFEINRKSRIDKAKKVLLTMALIGLEEKRKKEKTA